MTDALWTGLMAVLRWEQLAYMFAGTIAGMMVGLIPGLGPVTAMALLIPFTFSMDPLSALLCLASIAVAANCSGSFTSILLNVPGETSAAATCFDGHPLAQQGKATVAIGLSIGASFFAALVGMVVVIFAAQPLVAVALSFGPPEYFALAVLGLSLVSTLSQDAAGKGLVMAALGLCLSFVGVDAVIGEARFTGGVLELQDGVSLVAAMTGLFAVTEIIGWMSFRGTVSRVGHVTGSVWTGILDTFRHPLVLGRSTLVGLVAGVIPGVGAVAASFLAYGVERRVSTTPERFGKGAPEGVIAPEAANNSSICASLIPALTLGIPAGAASALLLVALTVHGIRPGSMLFQSQPQLVYGFFVGLMIGAVMFFVMGVLMTRWLSLVTLIRAEILAPVFLVVSFAGAYAQDQRIFDIFVALAMGVLGCLARLFGYPVVPLILGLVLGRLAETSFHQSLAISGRTYDIFFTRPLSASLLAVAALIVIAPFVLALARRRTAFRMEDA